MPKKSFIDFITQNTNLTESEKKLVVESWNQEKVKLAEEMRDEFSQRYKEDKAALVEGIQKMTEEVITENLQSVFTEKEKLAEDRKLVRKKLAEFADFSNGVLSEEVRQLHEDRQHVAESLVKYAEFTNKILSEEISEFRAEKQALTEARVKLLAEGRQKIEETRQRFVQRSAKAAAKFIQEQNEKELSELKQQLDEASKNMFGRKIFEAVQQEFLSQQFKINPILKELTESKEQYEQMINDQKILIDTLQESVKDSTKKVRIMEARVQRQKTLDNLMKPLTTEQRRIMESLLEKTQNSKLTEDFNKYLGAVLKHNNKSKTNVAQKKSVINESIKPVTGDREIIKESQISDENDDLIDNEIQNIVKLAGYGNNKS